MSHEDVKGLGGWLILVGVYIVTSPIRLLNTIYIQLFSGITLDALMSAGHDDNNPMWNYVLIGEFIYNLCLVVLSLYLIYLFFSKHFLFPRVFTIFILAPIIFIPLDSWAVRLIYPNEVIFDKNTLYNFVRVIVVGVIWLCYMFFSKRVKATFIEKKIKVV